jgi:hypothetical protein
MAVGPGPVLRRGGRAGPGPQGPKQASKLTAEMVARVAGLDAAGARLREIAAATGVSTFSVPNALGRVTPLEGGRAQTAGTAADDAPGEKEAQQQAPGRGTAGAAGPGTPRRRAGAGPASTGGWSPALFADILAAGFDLLTYRKGPAPDLPVATFTTVACADDRGAPPRLRPGRHHRDAGHHRGPAQRPGREPAAGHPPRPRPPRPHPPDPHHHLPGRT